MGIYYVAGIPFDSDYLQHHGIKGQKWGVRRFQYTDGKLTPEGKDRYRKEEKYFEKKIFTKGKVTSSMNDCEYFAWEYVDEKANRKAIRDAMNKNNNTTKQLDKAAKDFLAKSKNDIDEYIRCSRDLAYKLGVKTQDVDSEKMYNLLKQKYPEYVKVNNEVRNARENLISMISKAVDTGMFDSVFDGYLPISYKDDGYGPKRDRSRTVDGRKAVIASYVNEEYGNTDAYRSYGFEYLTPYDFEEFRDTKSGKLIKAG